LMAECQLSRRWADEDPKKAGNTRIRCLISHITGHSESFAAEAPPDMSGNKNDAQAVASIITYLRRTTLFSVLGLVANDEVDNDGAGGKTTEPARPKSQDLTNKAAQDLKRQFCEVCREKAKDPAMSMAAIKVAYGAVATEIASDDPALCLECVQGANVAITADGAVAFLTEKVE